MDRQTALEAMKNGTKVRATNQWGRSVEGTIDGEWVTYETRYNGWQRTSGAQAEYQGITGTTIYTVRFPISDKAQSAGDYTLEQIELIEPEEAPSEEALPEGVPQEAPQEAPQRILISKRYQVEAYRMRGSASYKGDQVESHSRRINGRAYDFSRVRWADGTVTVRTYEGGTTNVFHGWQGQAS